LECEYLQEARSHEKPKPYNESEKPNKDVRVSDEFLNEHDKFLQFTMITIVDAAMARGLVDYDVREALEALTTTYKTLRSGLYYESKPANLLAARLAAEVRVKIEDFRRQVTEATGLTRFRDSDALGVLVFIQRIEFRVNNGRKKGRAFIDMMRGQFGSPAEPSRHEPVIQL
jgi:archaellum component FlaC